METADTASRGHGPPRFDELVVLSEVLGWVYFGCWMVSYYPQVYENWKRGSTSGLSFWFYFVNLVGSVANLIYDSIKFALQRLHALATAVQVQDLASAVHGVTLLAVILGQMLRYDGCGWRHKRHRVLRWSVGALLIAGVVQAAMTAGGVQCLSDVPAGLLENCPLRTWTFTTYLAAVKIASTAIKYPPQIYANHRLKSTKGCAVWSFLLNATGGALGILQNLIDMWNYRDISYVTGNILKFAVSVLVLLYNGIVLFQHFVLYSHTSGLSKSLKLQPKGSNPQSKTTDFGKTEAIPTFTIATAERAV